MGPVQNQKKKHAILVLRLVIAICTPEAHRTKIKTKRNSCTETCHCNLHTGSPPVQNPKKRNSFTETCRCNLHTGGPPVQNQKKRSNSFTETCHCNLHTGGPPVQIH